MSTVAYRDGVIACDTQMTNGIENQFGITKIGRTRYYLFGYVGTLGGMLPAFEWLLSHENNTAVRKHGPEYLFRCMEDFPLEDSDGTILLANAQTCWTIAGGFVTPMPRRWEAIGSGGAYAVGAMKFGANAKEAVNVAINLDTCTGGFVRSLAVYPFSLATLAHVVKPGLIDT